MASESQCRLGLTYWKDHLSFLRTGFCENLNQAIEQRDPAWVWGQYRGKQPNLGEKWSLKRLDLSSWIQPCLKPFLLERVSQPQNCRQFGVRYFLLWGVFPYIIGCLTAGAHSTLLPLPPVTAKISPYIAKYPWSGGQITCVKNHCLRLPVSYVGQ